MKNAKRKAEDFVVELVLVSDVALSS